MVTSYQLPVASFQLPASRKPELSFLLPAGNRKPETGNWKLETGYGKDLKCD
jgi:hypothetical protein